MEEKDQERKSQWVGCPGGPVVKNPPSNAGYMGSVPGQGTKLSHATGQLSPCTTTRESERSNKDTVQPKKRNPNKQTEERQRKLKW